MLANSRANFLARRKAGIGGSDIAAICGLSPWRSPLEVWYDKTTALDASAVNEAAPTGETAPLYWGSQMEALVGKAYTLTTGRKIYRYNRLLQHPDYPYFIGDVDFLAAPSAEIGRKLAANSKGEIYTDKGIECKTSRFASEEWGEPGTDEVPPTYLCQVQWYMGLMPTVKSFDIPVLFGGSDFRVYTVNRDDALILHLQNIGKRFWVDNVLARVAPAPRTLEEVQKLYPTANLKSKVASVELESKVKDLAKIATLRLEAEKQEAQLKGEIAAEMGDAEALILPDETILATFKNERNSRVFRLKKQKQ